MNHSDCLIIGAGLSGLIAARELRQRGVTTQLLDKARGVGGRMATRRIADVDGETSGETAVFDHGAQFFTTRSEVFTAMTRAWIEAGVAREWFHGAPDENGSDQDGHPRYCGTRGMTGIAKYLARDLDVRLSRQVARLEITARGWKATTEDAENGDAEYFADTFILTPPVPQSLALLDAGGVALPDVSRAALEEIRYEPCVAVLALLDGPGRVPEPGARQIAAGPVAWIADNARKGISPRAGAVTIHATPAWSRRHYDDSDEVLIAALTEAAREYLGSEVRTAQVRRWRYSKPEATFPEPCLAATMEAEGGAWPLVFAGDAFAGPRVEGAVLSGLAAASRLIELLSK